MAETTTIPPTDISPQQRARDFQFAKQSDLQSAPGVGPIKTITAGYRPYMPASRVYALQATEGMQGSIMTRPKVSVAGAPQLAGGGSSSPMDFYFGPPKPGKPDKDWGETRAAYNQAAAPYGLTIDQLMGPAKTPNAGAFDAGARLSKEIKDAIEGKYWDKEIDAQQVLADMGINTFGKKEAELKDAFTLGHAVEIDSGRTGSLKDIWVYQQKGAKDKEYGGNYSSDGVDWARSTIEESQRTQKLLDILSFEAGDKTMEEYGRASGAEVTDAHDKWIMGGFDSKESDKELLAKQVNDHVQMRFSQLLTLMANEFDSDLNKIIKESFGMDKRANPDYVFRGGKYVDPVYNTILTETPHVIAKQFADRAKRIYAEEMSGGHGDGSYLYIVPLHAGNMAIIRFWPQVEMLNDKLQLTAWDSDTKVVATDGPGQGGVARLVMQHMIRQNKLDQDGINAITDLLATAATVEKALGNSRADKIGSRVMVDYGAFFGDKLQPYMAMAIILSSKEIAENLTKQINTFIASPDFSKGIGKVIQDATDKASDLTHLWKQTAYEGSGGMPDDLRQYKIWADQPMSTSAGGVIGQDLSFPFFIGTSRAVKAIEAASPTLSGDAAKVAPAVRWLYDEHRQGSELTKKLGYTGAVGNGWWEGSKGNRFMRPVYGKRSPTLEIVGTWGRGKARGRQSVYNVPWKTQRDRGG